MIYVVYFFFLNLNIFFIFVPQHKQVLHKGAFLKVGSFIGSN